MSQQGHYMTSMSANAYTLQKSNQASKPHTLVYSGSNNIYIKSAYTQLGPQQQQQQQQYQQQQAHNNLENNNISSYSTPLNSHLNKKLVYEVIV
jgi:hypothetical protein